MTNEEIIAVMEQPKSVSLINSYRQIYQIATGQQWTKCLCGNGHSNLYNACLKYAIKLKEGIKNNK